MVSEGALVKDAFGRELTLNGPIVLVVVLPAHGLVAVIVIV
jgi:hypothetical protein